MAPGYSILPIVGAPMDVVVWLPSMQDDEQQRDHGQR
jgi:hypothetical protein